jgi:hypothetical protein
MMNNTNLPIGQAASEGNSSHGNLQLCNMKAKHPKIKDLWNNLKGLYVTFHTE